VVGGKGWGRVRLGKVKKGEREGDNILDAVAVVVCEGRAKDKSAVPVRVPRKAVVRAGEGEAELARGMKWVGGKVVGVAVKARPGREGRIKLPRAEKV
jgi:hypothetical protein